MNQSCVCNRRGVLYRPTQLTPEEGGGGGGRAWICIKICTNRAFLGIFQPFLLLSLSLYRSWANRSEFAFCQFARHSSLLFILSAIAPKIKVRSRAKSDWAIWKSDVPSSVNSALYVNCTGVGEFHPICNEYANLFILSTLERTPVYTTVQYSTKLEKYTQFSCDLCLLGIYLYERGNLYLHNLS